MMKECPCGICGVNILESDEAICCEYCTVWHHRECLGMTLDFYLILSSSTEDWICRKCILNQEIKQEAHSSQCQRSRYNIMGKGKELKLECKKLDFLTGSQKCVFCNTSKVDDNKYGPIYMHKNIVTHYFCLLLSSNMEQNGRDSDGILGFLHTDILKEVKRGARLHCSFCKYIGATLGCAIGKCKVMFHLHCGLKHGTLHQFFGEFKSFCARHRPVQKISEKILAAASKDSTICGICYEKVTPRPIHETLWAPCCKKNAFFHRECVQKLAVSAGYFFKCPLCNNTDTFQHAMKNFGIYIPEQDASWECVPQAYQDLLVRHETCDSPSCSCPTGRKTNNEGTRWELILCKYCGSQGVHIGCGRLKWRSPEFECNICSSNSTNNSQQSRPIEGSGESPLGNRHRLSGGRQRISDSTPPRRDRDSRSSSDEREPRKSKDRPRKTVSTKARNSTLSNAQIIIDDSSSEDDYIEVVSDGFKSKRTFTSDYIKTNDGSVIPVVKIESKSGEKRYREKDDVKPLLDEVIDISLKMSGPSKKPKVAQWCETAYDQPSTSRGPSMSYVGSDANPFMLVDPTSLRPEDVPPGMMLYRSMQPVSVPSQQTTFQPQPQQQLVSQIPTTVPMQQLGTTRNADAKYSNLSKHRPWCGHYLNSQHLKKHSKKTPREIKCNSVGRERRRRCRGCDTDNRLNPLVKLSPLKTRTTSDGHLEIFIRRNLFPRNMKLSPLLSKPIKQLQLNGSTKKKHVKNCRTVGECPSNDQVNNSQKLNVLTVKKYKQNKMCNKLKVSFNYRKIEEYFIDFKKGDSGRKNESITESHVVVQSLMDDILSSCFTSDFNQDLPVSVLPQNEIKGNYNPSADSSPQIDAVSVPFETLYQVSNEIQCEANKNMLKAEPKQECSSEASEGASADLLSEDKYHMESEEISSLSKETQLGEGTPLFNNDEKHLTPNNVVPDIIFTYSKRKENNNSGKRSKSKDVIKLKTIQAPEADSSKKATIDKSQSKVKETVLSAESMQVCSSEASEGASADLISKVKYHIESEEIPPLSKETQSGEGTPLFNNDEKHLTPNNVDPKIIFTYSKRKENKSGNKSKSKDVIKLKTIQAPKADSSKKATIDKSQSKVKENVLSAESMQEYSSDVGEGASADLISKVKYHMESEEIPPLSKETQLGEGTPLFNNDEKHLTPNNVDPKIIFTYSKRKENKSGNKSKSKDVINIKLKTIQAPDADSSKKATIDKSQSKVKENVLSAESMQVCSSEASEGASADLISKVKYHMESEEIPPLSKETQSGEGTPLFNNDEKHLTPNNVDPKIIFTYSKRKENNKSGNKSKSKDVIKLKTIQAPDADSSKKATIDKSQSKVKETVLSAESMQEYSSDVGAGASVDTYIYKDGTLKKVDKISLHSGENQSEDDIPLSVYNKGISLKPMKISPKISFTHSSKRMKNDCSKTCQPRDEIKLKSKQPSKAEYSSDVGEGASVDTYIYKDETVTKVDKISLHSGENQLEDDIPHSVYNKGISLKPIKVFPKISFTHSSKRKENNYSKMSPEQVAARKQPPKAGSSKKARISMTSTGITENKKEGAHSSFYNINYFFKPTKNTPNGINYLIESKHQIDGNDNPMTSSISSHVAAAEIVNTSDSPHKTPLAELQVNSISSTVQGS